MKPNLHRFSHPLNMVSLHTQSIMGAVVQQVKLTGVSLLSSPWTYRQSQQAPRCLCSATPSEYGRSRCSQSARLVWGAGGECGCGGEGVSAGDECSGSCSSKRNVVTVARAGNTKEQLVDPFGSGCVPRTISRTRKTSRTTGSKYV